MIPVRERAQFAEAIKTKIIREIAGHEPGLPIIPAQAQRPARLRREPTGTGGQLRINFRRG